MKKFFTAICMAGLICGNISTVAAEDQGSDVKKNWTIQLEYLKGNLSNDRLIDNYNVHIYQKSHEHRALSFYRGMTVTRATGYTDRYRAGIHRDSEAVGVGAAGLLRWDKQASGKLHFHWDIGGSLMFYNKAHPAQGRGYGFLWRTGPGFSWQYRDDDSFSVSWYVSHSSNGMSNHNPGYNTMGVNVGLSHNF